MQLKHALLPIAVLAGSGIFLAKRQFAAVEKREQMAIFRETIRTVAAHREETRAAAVKAAAAQAGKEGGAVAPVTRESIDLPALAKALGKLGQGGFPDMKAMLKLQKTVLGLSVEDLSALVGEAAALKLPEDQKANLTMMLLQGLAQKDPKAALLAGQAALRESSGAQRTMLSMNTVAPAFKAWAAKEPEEAMRWYDAELAAGHFENKGLDSMSHEQVQFESGILPGLAERDPAAARSRLLAMSEEQRAAVLSSGNDFTTGAPRQKLFAELVRGTLPAENQAQVLANVASSIPNDGVDMKEVSSFLQGIAATPEEKSKILPAVAGSRLRNMAWGFSEPLTLETVTPLRKWMEREQDQPGAAGKALGESLAAVTGTGKFDEAEALGLVRKLVESEPSDPMIASFVASAGRRGNPENYRALAEKIQDPAERQRVLDGLNGGQPGGGNP